MKPFEAALATAVVWLVIVVLTTIIINFPKFTLILIGVMFMTIFSVIIYSGFRGHFDD